MEVGGGLSYQSWDCRDGGRGKLSNLFVWGTRKFGSIHRAYFTLIPNTIADISCLTGIRFGRNNTLIHISVVQTRLKA